MKWLTRLTYLYLTIPFIIFCMGWLRLPVAIPIVLFIGWVVWRLFLSEENTRGIESISIRSLIYVLLVTGLWVFFSGIGGYAFQNWDHNWRNAVMRDLVTHTWPVIYSSPEHGPITMLVYYVGYWLPAALAGRLFGWNVANFVLFLWTWLGVVLIVLQINLKLKISPIKAVLLLIFFSGMDALGALLSPSDYPTLWPPIQHLEVWAGSLQYSSFTTQLFWVFNQAVPAWLCIVLILELSTPESDSSLSENQKQASGLQITIIPKTFIWALCFFFAPLASIGLLIYLGIDWLEQIRDIIKNRFKGIRFELIAASLVIVLVSYLFFSANAAAHERGLQSLAFKDVFVFFLIEGGILWLLLAPRLWRNPRWVVTGILLFSMPFIQLGNSNDFVMRASVAPLFYLMLWSGEAVFQKRSTTFYRTAIIIILIIGALTPLYEINRSVYRTFQYYFLLDESQRVRPNTEPATQLEKGGAPEAEHPNAILADDVYSLALIQDKLAKNFIANVRQSLYYRYISAR